MKKNKKTVTDFEEWICQVDPDGHEEVYALYNVVKNGESDGFFHVDFTLRNTHMFIWLEHTDKLMLTAKAREYFPEWLTQKYCGEFDMESWYGYQCAVKNNP